MTTPHPKMLQAGEARIDWRERDSTTLADLYDGDWALLNAQRRDSSSLHPLRAAVRIPHPLPSVRYADGVAPRG